MSDGSQMTSTEKLQRLLPGQIRILKLFARDNPVEDALAALTGMVEELEPGAVAGVTIVDRAERPRLCRGAICSHHRRSRR
jgi:hypothetical protein